MDREQVMASIEVLRQRRTSLAEIRDYKPQRGGKKSTKDTITPVSDKPAEETFAGLFVEPQE